MRVLNFFSPPEPHTTPTVLPLTQVAMTGDWKFKAINYRKQLLGLKILFRFYGNFGFTMIVVVSILLQPNIKCDIRQNGLNSSIKTPDSESENPSLKENCDTISRQYIQLFKLGFWAYCTIFHFPPSSVRLFVTGVTSQLVSITWWFRPWQWYLEIFLNKGSLICPYNLHRICRRKRVKYFFW